VAGLRVGILGGTFDPVHDGHLALAHAAREEMDLAEVLFVLAGRPWRKAGRSIAPDEHRVAMVRLAIEGEQAFLVSMLELEREGPTYTADTLEALRESRPQDELFFILGEDALVDLPNWSRPGRILELAALVVARRAGVERSAVEEAGRRLTGLLDRAVWLKMPLVDISASDIRDRVRSGLPIGDLVPSAVEEYIREHGLYRT
jgi:nicotinate-nucleotide adenylyltransferase